MKGTIKQRSPGSWQIKYDLPRGADGKRRQQSVTVRGTKREAQAELARLLNEANLGAPAATRKLTLARYTERWLAEYAEVNWSATALRPAKSYLKNHILPALGHHPLSQLTPLHVRAYYAEKRKEGKLSEQTLLHHHRLLHQILGDAVKAEVLARNIMERVDAPRPRPEEPKAFTREQVRLVLDASRDTVLYMPILLAVSTGMRRGEILALRWEDVDLKAGVVLVRQSVTENGHAKVPKSGKARVIPLPEVAVEALRLRKEYYKTSVDSNNYRHVCTWEDGTPIRCDYLTNAFRKLAREIGLPSTRFHTLRHTHASHLLALGLDVVSVSKRLGHSMPSTTLDIYSHTIPGATDRASQLTDTFLRQGSCNE